jgi:hypothetical protein
MIIIGSVGSAPHVVKYTITRKVFTFCILPEPYSPNGNSHVDHNTSIDADFLEEVPFGMSKFAKKILGVIFAPKN